MSKTDKTKPFWVRVDEHHRWAEHDHRNGVCDLPERYADNDYSKGSHACRWSMWALALRETCCGGCGCRICSGYWWRREDRRRSRHEAKRQLRQALNAQEWEVVIQRLPTSW